MEEDQFEAQIKTLLEGALEAKRDLERRRIDIDRQMAIVDAELGAYNRTLEAYRRKFAKGATLYPDVSEADLRRMTVADGIETLLGRAGGRERIAVIARKLFQAGKLKNRRTANSHVRGVINREKRFIFVPGGWVEMAGPAQLPFGGERQG